MKIKGSRKIGRKAACIGLTVVMATTLIAGNLTAFADKSGSAGISSGQSLNFENVTGQVDLTDIKLNNLSKSVLENSDSSYKDQTRSVIVTLKGAPVLKGGEEEEIASEQNAFLKKLGASRIDYEYKSSYSTLLNAVAIDVKLSRLSEIKSLDGVSAVSVSSTYARPDGEGSDGAQYNYSSIYKNGIYDSEEYVEKGYDGSGMTVAILDTGLDYTHEAFPAAIEGVNRPSFSYDTVANAMTENTFKAEVRSGASASDVYVNEKVPFAYDYADSDADVYPSYNQHGTHVAGIVAGKSDSYTDKDGNIAVDENGNKLSFRGVAPEAQLVICKVFTDNLDDPELGGAETVDILDALEDCVNLNVDVINMSLGSSCGFSSAALGLSENDDEGLLMNTVYENIRYAGISLVVAASNDFSAGYGSAFGTNLASNPDSGTIGSPSPFSGAMSVASVNGQYSPYILANATVSGNTLTGGNAIYYEESRNEDSDAYNFLNDMLGDPKVNANALQSGTFKYVVVPGSGTSGDYTKTVRDALIDKKAGEKVIAVVKRGYNTFKEKIQIAASYGADAIIVYNNVSGMIRMSLEDLQERIPAISVSMDAGALLTGTGANRRTTGTITLDRSYEAGPFMNDYSSWGPTPDLKLKPDITSHGGEITSTVAGGYEEMSGTSMACPNFAGFTALLKGKVKTEQKYAPLWKVDSSDGQISKEEAFNLTKLVNNIAMSTAITVYDQNKLPYSPRKQGAGLATLKNVFSTEAYLYTDEADGMCEDSRPKAELGADKDKTGVYNITFYVRNFGDKTLNFTTKSIFMTETLGADGKSVAEKAHLFDSKGEWKVNGATVSEGGSFAVGKGETKVEVKISLSADEKRYLDNNFKNGMYVEGFLQLISSTDGQCDLTFPFMGFYGDWEQAPMLDYNCFEIAEFDRNSSLKDEERPKASVWATQAYSYYWNDRYSTPLGSFLYVQDEAKEHTAEYVYTEEEHIAISRFDEYYGETARNNYLTTTGIRALYAGLLRNAEIVTYTVTNEDTGEIIPDENGNGLREIYRVRKAYANGGNSVPAQVLMELKTEDMNIVGNGKYRLDFSFYFDYDDYAQGNGTDDTFTMSFYVDYEAPVLVDSRIRYQDRKDESGKQTQKIYLDLDVYDNHYPQAVILCYSDTGEISEDMTLKLATKYITPILNPNKNTTNTVTIDVTEFYNEYRGNLFVEIDDYAMNHNVYFIDSAGHSETAPCPSDFTVAQKEITLITNGTAKVSLENIGDANLSNFKWQSTNPAVVKVKNGELFGVSAGTARIIVSGGGKTETINVTVTKESKTLGVPTLSFGTILNSDDAPVKGQGVVAVNAGQKISLKIEADPWYYPINNLHFKWTSSDESLATVDENGNVAILYENDKSKSVTITAVSEEYASCSTSVVLSIKQPFTVSNGALTKYHGLGGELKDGVLIGGKKYDGVRVLTIPTDMAITSIADEAFKDNLEVDVVVIPKSVTTIGERAFEGCKNLRKISFITEATKAEGVPSDSSLYLISRDAFSGCDSLTTVDLSNCKIITLDRNVFTGCSALCEIINMQAIGTAYSQAFMNCVSMQSADLTKLHVAGDELFRGCTALSSVTIGNGTAIGRSMFYGCTALEQVEIGCAKVADSTFYGCTGLKKVTFNADGIQIGAYAFYDCSSLEDVTVNGSVSAVGDYAFGHTSVKNLSALRQKLINARLGTNVFYMLPGEAVVSDGKLVFVPDEVSSASILDGVTEIGDYAFSGSTLNGINSLDLTGVTKLGKGALCGLKGLTSVTLPDSLTEIPAYAFKGTDITSITIPASVRKIGEGAFDGCSSLSVIAFGQGSALTEIDANAFTGTGITALTLPDGVSYIGDRAFANNLRLTEANISSVKRMGEGAFMNCPKLATVTFGADATTTGNYTFWAFDISTGSQTASSLTYVELGDKINEIGAGAFAYCTSLVQIDLKNATEIGSEAFYGCSSLKTVAGIENVKVFGTAANGASEITGNSFTGCTSLTSLDLFAAEKIYYRSFSYCEKLSSLKLGSNLEGIGDEAFAGSALRTVTIPASCSYVGVSAFSGSLLLNYRVENGNENYFEENGVLYRYIDKEKPSYELVAYPVARTAANDGGVLTYTVKEGTLSIGEFAFASVPAGKVAKIVLPYTLKTVGNGAFYGCGITSYRFESIAAPVLLQRFIDRTVEGDYSSNSFFYINFAGYMSDFVPHSPGTSAAALSSLEIIYPSNGTGYDNYIYSHYFGIKTVSGELPEDNTRLLKAMLEEMPSAETVAGWNSTNTTKEKVQEFAASVKEAHVLYNGLKTDVQKEFVGQANLDKLFAVESALKPVKKSFGIAVRISNVAITADSAHKTAYVVGEKFSLDGLKIRITYDDYSQEEIEAQGNFVLATSYDRPLRASDNMVSLAGQGDYAGATLSVRGLTVMEEVDVEKPEAPSVVLPVVLGVCGGVLVIAAAVVAVIIVLRKKRSGAQASVEVPDAQEEKTDE